MKAFNCFVVMCAGFFISSDFAFGLSFGALHLRAVRKVDNEAAPSEDVFIPVTDDLLKKVEQRIAKMQESAIREINNQESPESLLDNLQNRTTKQLKIVGDKLIQTEEKVVSLGTKDNATIAIYKIINVRPISFYSEKEAEKSDSNQPSESPSETPTDKIEAEKSYSNQAPEQPSETPVDKTEAEKSDSSQPTEQSSGTSVDETESVNSDSDQLSEQVSETSDSSSDDPQIEPEASTSENTQTEAETQQPAQNDEVVAQDQAAQNESVQNQPFIMIAGPDGIPKPIHGIAIKIAPKSDGSQGKDVAFQFFRK